MLIYCSFFLMAGQNFNLSKIAFFGEKRKSKQWDRKVLFQHSEGFHPPCNSKVIVVDECYRTQVFQGASLFNGKLNSHGYMSERVVSNSGFGKTKLAKSIFEGFNSIQFHLIWWNHKIVYGSQILQLCSLERLLFVAVEKRKKQSSWIDRNSNKNLHLGKQKVCFHKWFHSILKSEAIKNHS